MHLCVQLIVVGFLELFGIVGNAVLIKVVLQCVLDGLFCQNRAVDLMGGQAIQCFADGCVGQFQCLVDR